MHRNGWCVSGGRSTRAGSCWRSVSNWLGVMGRLVFAGDVGLGLRSCAGRRSGSAAGSRAAAVGGFCVTVVRDPGKAFEPMAGWTAFRGRAAGGAVGAGGMSSAWSVGWQLANGQGGGDQGGAPGERKGGRTRGKPMRLAEIIFGVTESDEGGYEARALGHSIFTQGEDWNDLEGDGERRRGLPFRRG